jgi:hypothetical protein
MFTGPGSLPSLQGLRPFSSALENFPEGGLRSFFTPPSSPNGLGKIRHLADALLSEEVLRSVFVYRRSKQP